MKTDLTRSRFLQTIISTPRPTQNEQRGGYASIRLGMQALDLLLYDLVCQKLELALQIAKKG